MCENGKRRPVKIVESIQLYYTVRTFANVTIYPQYNNN
jgi:hypothetical protein